MKTITDYIYEYNSHLCNIIINEELKKVDYSNHGRKRRDGYIDLDKESFTQNRGLSEKEIRTLVNRADRNLINDYLNNSWDKTNQAISIFELKDNILQFVTFNIRNFDTNTFDYDIYVITCNEIVNKKKFNYKDTDVVYEKKGNYIKRIQ